MNLIRKKKNKKPHEHGLRAVALLLRGLVAQRVARKAYKGYKWTRRLPFLVAGAAIVAFVVRKTQQKTGGAPDAGFTPPAQTPAPSPVVATPAPTGSPTAVTPAPTAAADGAPPARVADEDTPPAS